MSSVLNIEYREGSKERLQGQVNASMTDFSGLCEGPIGENGSSSSGHDKSYLQYIKNMLVLPRKFIQRSMMCRSAGVSTGTAA